MQLEVERVYFILHSQVMLIFEGSQGSELRQKPEGHTACSSV